MRLLIFTQVIDRDNPVLGFFHDWVQKLAEKCETVTTLCLENGEHHLPPNVTVISLGKGRRVSKFRQLIRFYRVLWRELDNHDVALVHMTPVFVVLGWPLWRARGKKVFLWFNHPVGTPLTRLGIGLADTVFYTSPYAFAARFEKGKIMPAGIPTDLRTADPQRRFRSRGRRGSGAF